MGTTCVISAPGQYQSRARFQRVTCVSYPGDFSDGVFCDLLVNAKAGTTLEKGNGFPKVSLRHPHQRRYTLDEHKHQEDYIRATYLQRLMLMAPQLILLLPS